MNIHKLALEVERAMFDMRGVIRGNVVEVVWEEGNEVVGVIRNLEELYALKAKLQNESCVREF